MRFAPGDSRAHRSVESGRTQPDPPLPARKARARDRAARVVSARGRRAAGLPAPPEPLYTVAFDGSELWGSTAEPNSTVLADLWDSYLAPG